MSSRPCVVVAAVAVSLLTVAVPACAQKIPADLRSAFESRKARFQDAPELCFARLQRELLANADLPDGLAFVITPAEIDEYRDAQLRRSPDRKTRTLRTWP